MHSGELKYLNRKRHRLRATPAIHPAKTGYSTMERGVGYRFRAQV
ncbi:MAG TPA: hypothetical protein VIG30_01470 [Ktedonobacterales bacterium]|jgi:hypothetical protein